MIILSVILWIMIGLFFGYRAALTSIYWRHVKYPRINPSTYNPITNMEYIPFIIMAMMCGVTSISMVLVSMSFIPKDDPHKKLWDCLFIIKPNKVYKKYE